MSIGRNVLLCLLFLEISCNKDQLTDSIEDTESTPSSDEPDSGIPPDIPDSDPPAECSDPDAVDAGGPPDCPSIDTDNPGLSVLLVNHAAQAQGDGRTWSTAFRTIQEALRQGAINVKNSAESPPFEIWVAAGTYYVHETRRSNTIRLFSGVELYGGFSGDELAKWERNPWTNITEISGKNASTDESVYTVITGAEGVVVDGFLITGGNARNARYGGGMYNKNVSLRVNNCRFEDNHAGQSGGAMFNFNSVVIVTNCSFIGNTAGREGGAIYNLDSFAEFKNSVFAFNHSWKVGGAVLNHSNSDTEFINCTFYGNDVSSCGGAVAESYYSASTIVNSILWHDEAGEDPELCSIDSSVEQTISHSNIEGYVGNPFDLDADPEFVDAEGEDFELRADSPCIDRGVDELAPKSDRNGLPRVNRADMGAYEYQGDN